MQYDCVSRGQIYSLATSPGRQKEHKYFRTCIVFVNETNPRETKRVELDLALVQKSSKIGLDDMAKNSQNIFSVLNVINIDHNLHLQLMGKEMLSTYLLDLENECKCINLLAHKSSYICEIHLGGLCFKI